MKRPLLFLLLSLFSCNVFGQRIRFCDTANSWTNQWSNMHTWPQSGIGYSSFSTAHDTFYNGLKYLAIPSGGGLPSGVCLIREDTSIKRVFIVVLPNFGGHSIDTTEQVLYDYNWQVGDTIYRNYDSSEHYKHVVTSVDSIIINSGWHKVWHLQNVYISSTSVSTGPFDIIEGIGCLVGQFFPIRPMMFEYGYRIICFNNASGTPPLSQKVAGYFDNTTSCTLSVQDVSASQPASVYPNPITPSTRISLPYMMKSGIVQIVNTIGQVIWQRAVTNEKEIWIGDKITVDGMYYYRLSDKSSGSVFTGKLIK